MTDKDNYIAYIHRSKINGKVYVGITCRSPEKRWRKGNGYRGAHSFYADIREYGWDSFTHEIIAANLSKEEAARIEKELIKKFGSMNPEKGYNEKPGGTYGYIGKHHSEETKKLLAEKCSGWSHTEEAKRKISEAGKGQVFTSERRRHISESQKGRTFSEETRKKMSDARKGKKPWNAQKKLTDEHRRKLSESHKNSAYAMESSRRNIALAHAGVPWNGKKVLCVETGQTWETATAASKAIGCNQTSLSEACRIPHRKCKGYHWRYVSAEVS